MPDPMTPRPSRAEVERAMKELTEVFGQAGGGNATFSEGAQKWLSERLATLRRALDGAAPQGIAGMETVRPPLVIEDDLADGAAPETGEPVAWLICNASMQFTSDTFSSEAEAAAECALYNSSHSSQDKPFRVVPVSGPLPRRTAATPPSSPEARDNMLTFWDLPNSEQREVVARWIESEGLLETAVAIRSIGDVRNAEAARPRGAGGEK